MIAEKLIDIAEVVDAAIFGVSFGILFALVWYHSVEWVFRKLKLIHY